MLLIPQRYEFSSKSQHRIFLNQGNLCCCWYHKGTNFQANHNAGKAAPGAGTVVADTTKVRIFKQITTLKVVNIFLELLLLIPQRYEFSSKSQHRIFLNQGNVCCCWYHKGTNFQANHNIKYSKDLVTRVVADTTKVRIFKQITTQIRTYSWNWLLLLIPQRYEFSSKSQPIMLRIVYIFVVADTTKVRIFKQITTIIRSNHLMTKLLLIPQRYEFSSKSQPPRLCIVILRCCCWYHKGTNFQANHNTVRRSSVLFAVVADTTKVRIFKQITTPSESNVPTLMLLLIPQRYEFSSKSQQNRVVMYIYICCCWYHKGTNFQANHNKGLGYSLDVVVVADTTKVRIFKQITTFFKAYFDKYGCCWYHKGTNFQANHNILVLRIFLITLLLIPQRYEFSSKSQHVEYSLYKWICCCWYHKGTNFQANHNLDDTYSQADTVVADTTKVRIFKQITTKVNHLVMTCVLLLIPQRYEFSSKSQPKR